MPGSFPDHGRSGTRGYRRDVYRFLTRPSWILGLVGCLLAALVMVRLGIWQLDRLDEKRTRNATVEAATDAPARPIGQVLPTSADDNPNAADVWSKVNVTGEYDESGQVLVRGRTLNGDVGFEVLTPLVLADGSAVLVDRGWLAAPAEGDATTQPDVPSPPSGTVDVVGRARTSETYGGVKPDHGDGLPSVRSIDVPALADDLDRPVYGGYLMLVSEDPKPASAPTLLPLPELDEGPHLSYAVQWFLFSGLALVGYGILVRREAAARAEGGEDEIERPRFDGFGEFADDDYVERYRDDARDGEPDRDPGGIDPTAPAAADPGSNADGTGDESAVRRSGDRAAEATDRQDHDVRTGPVGSSNG